MDAQLAKHIGFMKPIAQNVVHNVSRTAINGLLKGRIDLEQAATQMISSTILNISAPTIINGLVWADRAVFNNQATRQMQSQNALRQNKHHSNARKENVHRISSTHTRKALSPEAFMEKMGIKGLKKDLNEGVDTARNGLVHNFMHPIETAIGVSNTLKEIGIFAFDGVNLSTDLLFNVSTQGSRDRNAARVASVDKFATDFANANVATRMRVVTSKFIMESAVSVVVVGAAGGAVVRATTDEALVVRVSKFKEGFFKQKNKSEINVGSLENPLPRSLDSLRTREWYHKELDKFSPLINSKHTLRQRALKFIPF